MIGTHIIITTPEYVGLTGKIVKRHGAYYKVRLDLPLRGSLRLHKEEFMVSKKELLKQYFQ
jgi:hypothetical protein